MDEASLTLYKLRVFCEVVELQSFTGAAARLHTTQPALSLHMRSLEKFFGAPLVRQEGRRTVLTEAGHFPHLQTPAALATLASDFLG